MFHSVLVANRGEIAVRIISTLRRLGIRPVLAAAAPDRLSLAARSASEVVLLPGNSAAETYLNIDALVGVASKSGCEALHPGYGFLSESAALARACAAAGIAFVGPPPDALELLGDKLRARKLAASLGIPVVPGWQQDDRDDTTVIAAAEALGYPLMLKARAGGGGRGMRRLFEAGGLPETIAAARREAFASFGDDGLFLEKLVTGAHHVEVQVVGDASGSVLHFGERDCSVQRRHQKLFEESPSPVVDAALRARLTGDAVRLCEAAGYRNAGTVEFLVGRHAASGEHPYYFLEVNPRLQVEHPVTEAVAGVDLVELQLLVAAGEPLGIQQDSISLTGAAIEVRLNAESPRRGFEPSPGRIDKLALPGGIRVDMGYAEGDVVPAQFDSLLGKLIAHGSDRRDALTRARRALASLSVVGPATNAIFLDRVLSHETFVLGDATIDWLDSELPALLEQSSPGPPVIAAAAAANVREPMAAAPFATPRWIGAGRAALWLWDGESTHAVSLGIDGSGEGTVLVDGREIPIGPPAAYGSARIADADYEVVSRLGGRVDVHTPAGRYTFTVVPPPPLPRVVRAYAGTGARLVTAPLAGTVAVVHVNIGQAVAAGDALVTLEAMKMEHRIAADAVAVVAAILVAEGTVVARGEPLVELAAAP